jgi:2-oxoisovalerate dehydrogenase E1 component
MTKYHGFDKGELLEIYKLMFLSRKMDEKMLNLLRQGRVHFHIGAAGHEAAQIAAAANFIAGKDWAYPYYRDQAFLLRWGQTIRELFLQYLAKRDDLSGSGRQLPQHFGHKELRVVCQSSPTGTQYLQAVGTAMGAVKDKTDEVVYVSSGEGATSEGEFHEALNWASRDKLPVIFHVEDNHFAISVPKTQQTSGASVYNIVCGYENLGRYEVNGTNFFETHIAFANSVKRAREGKGPSVVVSDVIRLLPHSSSDDHAKYRSKEELEKDRQRDPIAIFMDHGVKEKLFTKKDIEKVKQEVLELIEETTDWALEQPDPEPEDAMKNLYVSWLNLTEETPPKSTGQPIMLLEAVNRALKEEMERNPRTIAFGEDIADPKGGVFTVTKGLTDLIGKERVFNSPIAEASIVGTAIGLAIRGFKPVVEIQFMDYIWPAMMQIKDELVTMYYRSNGAYKADVVIRTPVGAYIHGGLYHSQTADSIFAHIPGIRVVFPSNAADAKGLLKEAIRGEDPVLFLEHKGLYRSRLTERPEPDADYTIPLGLAKIVQEGEDLTVVTWGMQVYQSADALKQLTDLDCSVEVIDIRTLNPLDFDTIFASVKKTGKVLIVHEDHLTGGFGGEIAAGIASEAFEFLDGPIMRVAAEDVHHPYHPKMENRMLPQVDDIAKAMRKLLIY